MKKKIIRKSREYQDRKGPGLNSKKIVKNENYDRNNLVKEIKWNFHKNEIVYVKSGYAEVLSTNKTLNRGAITINDSYVLIVGDKEYKTYRSKRNYFFILYKDAVYMIDGKFIKSI